jgi:zeaxanthin glucosyltransferase
MRIGFVSLPLMGHLNPMTALARKLQSRGDEVRFIGVPDIEPAVRAANLAFEPYCEEEYPRGSVARIYAPIAKLHGLDVLRYQVEEISPKFLQAGLKHLPQKLVETGVEALVLDAVTLLQLVPMTLDMPFVQIWNTLHLDFSGATPPTVFGWPHERNAESRARNIEGVKIIGNLFAPIRAVAQTYAKENGLKIDWSDPSATTSKLAVITQTPREFDFAGTPWPGHFYYTGPLHDGEGREQVDFPWEKLNGEPLLYASLGSLVNGQPRIYRTILGAVGKLKGIQIVLSIGRDLNIDDLGSIPANTLVVRSAPQIELLKRAVLCITHAGLNTSLESLAQGVPMVAIPIGYDQPGIAARIAHHGVGEFVEVEDLTIEGLSRRITKVLRDPAYRSRAQYFRSVIVKTRGLDLTADVIERALLTRADVALVNSCRHSGASPRWD